MDETLENALREQILAKRTELRERLERIEKNVRRPLHLNSKERAKELENHEVVDALGSEAQQELLKISDAMDRMASGRFGVCVTCSLPIDYRRLQAYPYALECIQCAMTGEIKQFRQ